MTRIALAAFLLLSAAAPALGSCPAPPPGAALPLAARPAPLDNPLWHDFVGQVDQAIAAADRGRVQLAFLGDSLTAGWEPAAFARHFGRWRTLNLGVPGDHTHTMLWRLDRQWTGLRPRVAVLLLGTNNAGTTPPADTALGVAEVIRLVQARSPGTKLLLLALLPRGDGPADPQRRANAEVDRLVAGCADGRRVVFLDAGAALAGADGRLAPGHFTDGLHLSPQGYEALGAAIAPTVARMMR